MDLAICASCKFTSNGPCTLGNGDACVMAPYFPSTEPDKFDRVNKVFGVVNVYKILSVLEAEAREYAANALCYEAEARIQEDPIHGYFDPKLASNNILNKFKRDIDSAINELEIPMDKDQKNQLKRLVDARGNVEEIVGMRENDQGDVHRADGASTSSGPPNQNQP